MPVPALRYTLFSLLTMSALCLSAAGVASAQSPFVFRDTGDETGLFPAVGGIAGHGVAWGDVDGDGWADLYVGSFGGSPYDSKPNQFFRNREGKFQLDDQKALRVVGRANGAVFADFDNDGDLDLYTTNHSINGRTPERAHFSEPNHLFRNDGGGKFTDVSQGSGVSPEGIASRSATVTDFDGDGLLDLLVGECYFQGGQSRSKLYRNQGGLKFREVNAEVGLPEQVTGFGVAAGDVNGDGWPDLFIAGRHHGNRLFLNDGKGKFTEAGADVGDFAWKYEDTADDTTCGVCIADTNRDGKLDILIGSHFSRPWTTGGVPVRLYLNVGSKGKPRFENVTEKAGLVPLPLKSPHVEVQDFDNDGWPDIYTSIVKFAGDQPHPVIFRNLGASGSQSLPKFRTDALAVNDFPTEEDKQIKSSGKFFDKLIQEHKIIYTAPGPSGDYDRDGRLDLFLANWWVEERSLLLHNETKSGNWLDVQVSAVGKDNVNRMGVGSVVRIYPAGKLGDEKSLLGHREIAVGFGYASGQEAIAHFGLGDVAACDVEVLLPHNRGRIVRKNIKADQRITVAAE